MKTKLTIAMLALVLVLSVSAQIQTIDVTTRTTNTTSSSALITITNVCTNAVYTTLNTKTLTIGDALATAFGKVNGNFSYVWNYLLTNNFGGGGSGAATNLTPWTSDINAAGYSLNNAGGVTTTNLSVIGDTFLNNSNLHVFYVSPVIATNHVGYVSLHHSFGYDPTWVVDTVCTNNGTGNYYVGNVDPSLANIVYTNTFNAASNCWVVTENGSWYGSTTNSLGVQYPDNGSVLYLYNASGAIENYPGVQSSLTFMLTNQVPTYTTNPPTGYNEISSSNCLVIMSTNGVGGVAINTNNVGGNALRVAGNVDSSGPSAGFSINGVPISGLGGGGSSNYVHDLEGIGTNTTIGFRTTNFFLTPMVLTLCTNAAINGAYYYDADTNSAAYTNFPAGQYMTASNTVATYYPLKVWTNSSGTNNFEMNLISWGYQNPAVYVVVVTNGGVLGQIYNGGWYESYGPDGNGQWELWTTATQGIFPYSTNGCPFCVGTRSETNYVFTPIIAEGQLQPMVRDFILDDSTIVYSQMHNLGRDPVNVNWYLVCIHPDVHLLTNPGDKILFTAYDSTYSFGFYFNSRAVWLSCIRPFVGQEGNYSFQTSAGGQVVTLDSFTNFLLRVVYQ
jgi:hypothetical protein